MNKIDVIHLMERIVQDTAEDAKKFDGKPFNGQTVGEYFGYHGAAITALATTIKSICEILED